MQSAQHRTCAWWGRSISGTNYLCHLPTPPPHPLPRTWRAAGSSLRHGAAHCPQPPSPSSPPPLLPTLLVNLSLPPYPRQLFTVPFCQGSQIGQISVMLKNWPISWQGTLTGGKSGMHLCHRCVGRGAGERGLSGSLEELATPREWAAVWVCLCTCMGACVHAHMCVEGPTVCQTCCWGLV